MEMDLKSSYSRTGLPPPHRVSDPEKEISDDDDDDRNHKHRRQDTRSQFADRDAIEQSMSQPYRKRNRPFENGLSNPQSHYSSDRDFSKFEKRHQTGVNFSRFSGDQGSGRGGGRDYQRDSQFGLVDILSQASHPGSISSAMFSGRGLPNASNVQCWNGFGLIPAYPNGAIGAMNPLGLPGILRPQLTPSLNMGIQRQCCRDFEERGFCLRGDMCPMEHGLNRIVVKDVQGLSQFNLPASLESGHILRSSAGSGFGPVVGASSSPLINSRGLNNNKSVANDTLDFDGYSGVISACGGDVYDPDQPLWNHGGHQTSTPFEIQPPNFDEPETLLDSDLSDRLVRSSQAAVGLQSTSPSVWGKFHNSKHKLGLKEKFAPTTKPSEYSESISREICEAPGSTQGASPRLGKKKNGPTFGPTAGSVSKLQSDIGSGARKLTQKAQRTLFVNGIPAKDNKKENLLSHFRKFGHVIDIYIPANSERAFLQFSKREEAERALKAPDAVMGSRFIKLWWANRDSIADDGIRNGNNVSVTPGDGTAVFASPYPVQYSASKVVVPNIPDSIATVGSDSKPVTSNDPKSPLVQKKMESLELLKELRKKQEMLEQKRNEFRKQLDKLAKQATRDKHVLPTEQTAKRQKVETSANDIKSGNTQSTNANTSSSKTEVPAVKVENVESIACQKYKTKDPQTLKQTLHPADIFGTPFHINRYKLDNRPKSFKLNAPLPAGLASVAALRDHFSSFGEITNMEIEELGEENTPNTSNDSGVMRNCSARISFTSRHSAERAFLNGKLWHGHNLHFVWVTPNIPCSSLSSGESSSALKAALNAEVQSANITKPTNSLEASCPTQSHSTPPELLNEVSCSSARSSDRGSFAVEEEHPVYEAESLDKSGNYVPSEADEPESEDMEVPEDIAGLTPIAG